MTTNAIATISQTNDFESILAQRDLATTTRYRYGREIIKAQEAGVNLLDAADVADYATTLPSSRKMFLRAAVALIADNLTAKAKASATPDNVQAMQAIMWRADALKGSIHVQASKGQRAHTWLNLSEVRALLTNLTDATTAKGLRDRVVFGLLLGAGLRRDELVNLKWGDIKTQGERSVLNVTGKGNKARVIPVSDALVSLLGKWGDKIDPEGYVIRSVDKAGNVAAYDKPMSGQAVLDIVDAYGQELGKEKLRPHDLRRTYARIGYDAGVDIGQISKLLGHASIATTQRYLGLDVDLKKTISDFIPFT